MKKIMWGLAVYIKCQPPVTRLRKFFNLNRPNGLKYLIFIKAGNVNSEHE